MSTEDHAQEQEARDWASLNINGPRLPGVKKPGEPGYGPEACRKCGDDMPELRRANGWDLCTPCKAAQERPRR